MRRLYVVLTVMMSLSILVGMAHAEQTIADTDLGLSKASVFEATSPKAFAYGEAFPGSSKNLPRAYPGAPPQIPHSIDSFLPVTMHNNMCVDCHDKPEVSGEVPEDEPTPMPASHYTDLRRKPGKVTNKLIGARFICTQCHVPQANVNPLVENTFQ